MPGTRAESRALRIEHRALPLPCAYRRTHSTNVTFVIAFACFLLGFGGRVAAEPERCTPAIASYAAVVERAAPAIVSIKRILAQNSNVVQSAESGGRDAEIGSSGSGVIVDESGLIVTSSHGLEGRGPIKVTLNNGQEFEAEIVLVDRRTDLAVVRLKGVRDLPVAQFANSDDVRAGDFAIAIGNPLEVGQTITHGIVSAVGRTQIQLNAYEYYIQTDTPMNPGSSGGALFDTSGRLIGITVAIASQGKGWQGIGFAVPANMVSFVLNFARNGDKVVRRPWLGAKLNPIDMRTASRLGLKGPAGAMIERVINDSPAAIAGLRPGDVIVSLDGEPIRDPNSFDYRFTTKGTTGSTRVDLVRDRQQATIQVELKPAPDVATREIVPIKSASPMRGATMATLTPALAEELGLDANAEGVAVVDVETGTPADTYDFQRGDILLSINQVPIKRAADVEKMVRNPRTAIFELDREGDIIQKEVMRKKQSW